MLSVVFQTLAILGSLIHGFFNGAAQQGTDTSVTSGAGIVVSAWVIAVLLSEIAVTVHHAWQQMVLRVIGSCISAFGLLALVWCMID